MARGPISIAHEHFATELISSLARDLLRLSQPTGSRRRVLLACFPEEQHSIALYGVGFRLAELGYRSVLLGPRTPPSALALAVRTLQPPLVGLSVTVAPAPADARELLEQYLLGIGDLPWIVGGAGASQLADVIETLGGVAAPTGDGELSLVLKRMIAG